jgi:hypothetical protein
MNGAVFQVSAKTTASLAWKPSVVHRICPGRSAFATPSVLKIHRHSNATTAVGTAHGTRMLARTRARPRSARCMTSAIATPMTVSSATVVTVKNVVLPKAFQKRSPAAPKIAV